MLVGEHMVARVIARPFTGKPGAFRRTERRKDFSVTPPSETLLDFLSGRGIKTVGVGKIKDIFAGRGLAESYHTGNNRQTMETVLRIAREDHSEALVFANCVDFDSLYGHRNDPQGFAGALEEADRSLGELAGLLGKEDLLIVTADHGNDPTTPSTDHSREYVPLLVVGEMVAKGRNLGTRESFADLSATLAEVFSCDGWEKGKSFYAELKKPMNVWMGAFCRGFTRCYRAKKTGSQDLPVTGLSLYSRGNCPFWHGGWRAGEKILYP